MRLRLHARLRVEDAQSLNSSLPVGRLSLAAGIGNDCAAQASTQGLDSSEGSYASGLAAVGARIECPTRWNIERLVAGAYR